MAQYSPNFISLVLPFFNPPLTLFCVGSLLILYSILFLSLFLYFESLKDQMKINMTSETHVFPCSSSVLAQYILPRCPFDRHNSFCFSLMLSEPWVSPPRKLSVLLMHCCSYWVQLCQGRQHQRQVCLLYTVCVWSENMTMHVRGIKCFPCPSWLPSIIKQHLKHP